MNAMLRIQVKLLAKEANAELRNLATAISQVAHSGGGGSRGATAGLDSSLKATSAELRQIQDRINALGAAKSWTSAGKDATTYLKKIEEINQAINQVGKNGPGKWQAPPETVVNVKQGRAAAAAAAKETEAIAASTARAVERSTAKEAQATAKAIAQQISDRRRGAAAQTATVREADAQQREADRQRDSYLKQIWKEQTSTFKEQQKQQTAATKEALKQQKEAVKAAATAAKTASSSSGSGGIGPDAANNLSFFGRVSQKVNGDINTTRKGIVGMGKDLQWVGRQINFNFTLPLLYAGKKALDFVLANETAFTLLKKVYSGAADDLKPIKEGLRLLSDYYGINQADVISLGEAWAAAGFQGANLLKQVETSIQLASLGDYSNITDTFKDLIVIQKAYGLSTDGLTLAVAKLNTAEDANASTMQDLTTAVALVGSSARVAGIDLDHLIAFMAVLVPATGSASRASNSFKTIVAQLTAPTDAVKAALKDMGIDFYDTSFQALNAGERLQVVAEKFKGLTSAQQAFIARTLGSLWGINKFSALMADVNNKTGEFQKTLALLGSGNATANLQQAQKEIQTILDSDPQKFKRLMTMLQNMAADVILPLLPSIIGLLTLIKEMAQWFGNLSPTIQKAAVGVLIFISAIGILTQMIGSVELLFGTFAKFILFMVGMIPGVGVEAAAATAVVAAEATGVTAAIATEAAVATAIVAGEATAAASAVAEAALVEVGVVASAASAIAAEAGAGMAATAAEATAATGPVGWAIAGIVIALAAAGVIIYKNWETIKLWFREGIKAIIKGFHALPEALANVFRAVISVISRAVKIAIEWLSYLNPFAHHSPSLVENVTAGIDAILLQYGRVGNISSIFARAAAGLEAFAAATAAAVAAGKEADRAQQTSDVVSVAPQAGGPLQQLYGSMDQLQPQADLLTKAIKDQEAVVAQAKFAYDEASNAVDAFDASLEPLRKHISDLKNEIDAAKSKINEFANTQITGMQAASDAIFANEMAQKALRLEILKLAQTGNSYDKLMEKMSNINGEIEMLRGKMSDLRAAGAGSDILSVYQGQIDALDAQKSGLADSAASAKALEDQLGTLQTQGEILDLQKSLDFDPLLRQIDLLINGLNELPFADIIQGIKDQQANVTSLTKDYDASNVVLDEQTTKLDDMKAARDALKASYDEETTHLDALKTAYQAIVDQLTAIKDAIDNVVSAKKALDSASAAGGGAGSGGGAAGGGGGFGDLTGDYTNESMTVEQLRNAARAAQDAAQNAKDWLEEFKKKMADMFKGFNPFGFLQKAWDWVKRISGEAWQWIQTTWDSILNFFKGFPQKVWDGITGGIATLGNLGASFINWIWEGITSSIPILLDWAVAFPGNLLGWVTTGLQTIVDLGASFIDWIVMGLINNIGAIAAWFVGLPAMIVSWLWDVGTWLQESGAKTIGGFLFGIVQKASEVVTWFINLGLNVLEWIGDLAKTLWDKGTDIIGGMLGGVSQKAGELTTWVTGLPTRFLDWLGTVTDTLRQKGIDFITGLIKGIGEKEIEIWHWFTNLASTVWDKIGDVVGYLKDKGVDFVLGIVNGITEKATALWNWFTDLPGNIWDLIGDVVGYLKDKGVDFISGIISGIGEKAAEIWTWFKNLGSTIISNIPNPLDILYNVGLDIMNGMWKGLKEIWKKITSWFSTITDLIPDWKGPRERDAQLLNESGQLVMQGFQEGLTSGWIETQRLLSRMTNEMPSKFDTTLVNKAVSSFELKAANTVQPVGTTNVDNSTITHITISDVSFPNITTPSDASKFLTNLEAMAG